ncbi:MAG: hypothetical protein ACAI38_09585, partial [Myxococcota bacterium]
MRCASLAVLFAFLTTTTAVSHPAVAAEVATNKDQTYSQVIQRVVAMPGDGELQERAGKFGLNVLDVLWEDTGRAGGSAIGPNISDVTLQVREP